MKQAKFSAKKRFTKPILFGTLIFGLATAFFNRHMFLEDVAEIRAKEQAHYDMKRIEILERRQRMLEEGGREEERREQLNAADLDYY